MFKESWRILLLFYIFHGFSCKIIKYRETEWNISDLPTRPCRADEGYHLCIGDYICVARIRAPEVCSDHPRLKCNDDEMEIYSRNMLPGYPYRYRCVERRLTKLFRGMENMYLPCHPTEFKCSTSNICISRSWVQDGDGDCRPISYGLVAASNFYSDLDDRSDEMNFLPDCYSETEIRCNGSKPRCIPRSFLMDGKEDCKNSEDETTTLKCNLQTEYECVHSEQCILRQYVNDMFGDCQNNTDEKVKNFTCNDQLEFSCEKVDGVGRCIPKEWVGNGVYDCRNGEDEKNLTLNCDDERFSCLDRTRCLPKKYLCDGIQNCKDGSDEVELCTSPTMYRYMPQRLIPWSFLLFETTDSITTYFHDFQPQHDLSIGLKCYVNKLVGDKTIEFTRLRTIPQFYILSNISVCANYEDVCFDSQSTFTCARCMDGTIISKSQVCDGVIDCADLSDECPCEKSIVDELCENIFSFDSKSSENMTTNMNMICNGTVEMKNGIDELYCNKEVLDFSSGTGKHDFTCSMSNMSSISDKKPMFCDGIVDCTHMDDECTNNCLRTIVESSGHMQNCFPFLFSYSFPGGPSIHFYNISIASDGHKQIYINTNKQKNKTNHKVICEYMAFSIGKFILISSLIGAEQPSSIFTTLYASYPQENENLCKIYGNDTSKIFLSYDFVCDIKGVDCPWFYFCDDRETKIELWRRCDNKIDCRDNTDEENCPSETHYYCINGDPWFIPRSKVGDGRSDCSDRSDEQIETAFSSGTEMLKNPFLRIFVWFYAFTVMICNCVVLRKHFIKIGKIESKTTVAFSNTYLLISLAISDVIFGFVLLTIGVKSHQFSGRYYQFDLEWRSSFTCNMIGIFTVVSSQTSMNLLVLMTGLRVYVTFFPYQMKRIKFNLLMCFSFVSLAVSIILACIPVWVNQSFINFFHVNPNFFINVDVVEPSRVEKYVRKTEIVSLLTNFDHNVFETGHDTFISQKMENWYFNSEEGRENFPNRQIDIRGNFGFYSYSAVCFPNFFSQTRPASSYSIFIVLYNLFCLFLIGLGYICIWCRATKSGACVKTANEARTNKKNQKMMTRIFLIIVTDVVCWLPIIIMSFISYHGLVLPDIVHPLSAIVFLPINSIINPVIYSRLDKAIIRSLKNLFCPIWKRCCQTETSVVEEAPMKKVNKQTRTTQAGSKS